MTKHLIIRDSDGELLGFVEHSAGSWSAQTIFGYIIARASTQDEAEQVVRSEGLLVLKGIWRYYDEREHDWYPCILQEVHPSRVIVVRTNEMGYQDPSNYKMTILKNPSETVLVKA